MNIKKLAIAAALATCGTVAQAGFVTVSTLLPSETINIVPQNDFKSILASPSIGVTQYTVGASLWVDQAGTVEYYYYGKEAGYKNIFYTGSYSYDTGFSPTSQNYFANPVSIGGPVAVSGGPLSFAFCAFSAPNVSVGCVSNALNDLLSFGSNQSIAFAASGNVAWLFWDDSGAGPDDNHDDMLIKAVFRPSSVPEPATLGLFGLGLLGTWFAARRRKLVGTTH